MGKKILIAFASTTGNTEAMAKAILEGAKSVGADAELFDLSEGAPSIEGYDVVALGSPAMGAEILEESFMEPFFTGIEGSLAGKNIALFGSYDWGEGQWLSDWEERAVNAGASLATQSLKLRLSPDEEGLELCKKFGVEIAQ